MNEDHMLSMERGKLNCTSVGMPTTLTAGRDRLCWHPGCIHSADSRFNYIRFPLFYSGKSNLILQTFKMVTIDRASAELVTMEEARPYRTAHDKSADCVQNY